MGVSLPLASGGERMRDRRFGKIVAHMEAAGLSKKFAYLDLRGEIGPAPPVAARQTGCLACYIPTHEKGRAASPPIFYSPYTFL